MKITSEICKQELDTRFPESLGVNSGGWKRVSKTGNQTAGIVRVFQHRKLAVSATVIEKQSAIVSVEFTQAGDSSTSVGGQKTAVEATGPAPSASNSATSNPVTASDPAASQFLFAVLKSCDNGRRHFAVCPVEFWRQQRHMSDSLDSQTLETLLPKGSGVDAEGFYNSILSKKALREFLLAKGFQEDPSFTDYIVDIW